MENSKYLIVGAWLLSITLLSISSSASATKVCVKYKSDLLSASNYEKQFKLYVGQISDQKSIRKAYSWLERTACLGHEKSILEYIERYSDDESLKDNALSLWRDHVKFESTKLSAEILMSGIKFIKERNPRLALDLYQYSLVNLKDEESKRVALHGIMSMLEKLGFPCGESRYWYGRLSKGLVKGGAVDLYYVNRIEGCETKMEATIRGVLDY